MSERPFIFLVESDTQLLDLISTILRDFEVRTACSGPSALALLKQLETPPQLLITETVLSGISGLVVAETFSARFPDTPVLLITTEAVDVDIERGLRKDWTFIVKPFTPQVLRTVVRTVLSAR